MRLQRSALSATADGRLTSAAKVQATLYYQSIPPYYLRQRAEDANGPDTARLINFTNQLNVGTKYPEIANWKLKIASSGLVDIPVNGVGTLRKSERSFSRQVYDAPETTGRLTL